MTPSNRLRFVGREAPAPEHGPTESKIIRVLQQWWQSGPHPLDGEWRDVPLEEEE